MSNGYIESSLKRFLKRKVKVTLGLVVAFMITGTVGFAEENSYEKWLTGIGEIGKNLNSGKVESDKIAVQAEDKGNIKITFKDTGEEIEIKNEELSTETIKNINEAMENAEKALDWENNIADRDNYEIGMNAEATTVGNKAVDGQIIINTNKIVDAEYTGKTNIKGEKLFAGQTVLGNGTAVNKGDIEITKDSTLYFGQYIDGENAVGYNYGNIILKNETADAKDKIERAQNAVNGGTVYNYGYIEVVNHAQILQSSSTGYNYGKLYSTSAYSQFIDTESVGYNYGILEAKGMSGQYVSNNSFGYNYGIIMNDGDTGQYASNNSLGYNYGIIMNDGDTGQHSVLDSVSFNYGIIANKGNNGQYTKNGLIYNYGIIANKGTYGQNISYGTGYNYGTIANKGDSGLVIWNGGTGYNYGIVTNEGSNGMHLYSNSNLANEKAVAYNIGIIANKGNVNIFKGQNSTAHNAGILFNYKGVSITGEIQNNGVIVMKDEGQGVRDEQYDSTTIGNGIEINAKDEKNIIFSQIGENMFAAVNPNSELNEAIYKEDLTSSWGKAVELTEQEKKDKIFDSDKTLSSEQNLFVDHYTSHKLAEEFNLKQDSLTNNRITTIVGKDTTVNGAINHSGNLSLDKSTIVGYFEKSGTLLNITGKDGKNGNLTLTDSFIGAYAGNTFTGLDKKVDDVYAVNLNGGSLTLHNSLIIGGIKGQGHIDVEDAEDIIYENIYLNKNGESDGEIVFATTENNEMNAGFRNSSVEGIDLNFKGNKNELTLNNNVVIKSTGIDGENSEKGFVLNIGDGNIENENTIDITGNITLGKENDTLNINNNFAHNGVIKGGTGDILNINTFNQNGKIQSFDKKAENFSEINLKNGDWTIKDGGHIKGNNTVLNIDGNFVGSLSGNSADVNTSLDNTIEGKAEINADKVRFDMGTLAINSLNDKFVIEKNNDVTIGNIGTADVLDKISISEIFNKKSENNGIHLTIKSAEEMGISNKTLYEAVLKNYGANREIYNVINTGTEKEIASLFNEISSNLEIAVTNGYKITRDVTKGFINSVNEFDKKANKGEWLTQAKYINSDTELENNAKITGYDGDINSMAGMVEYGISENISLGVVLGGGSTEIEMNNGKKLDGDNYFVGLYSKADYKGYHMVGTVGYTLNELDIENGKEADSSAISLGGYVHKDIYITDTVKLMPNISAVYEYIDVDDAEMYNGIKAVGEKYNVLDTTAGLDIAKEYALETGKLTLKAGAEYSYAFISGDEDIDVDIFGVRENNFGDSDLDKSRFSTNIGFDYEHISGLGVNGKYETMWSDSGDDSRITAGISYRF